MSIAWQEWEMFFKVCARLFVCVCVEEKEKETDWFAASSRKKSSQQRYVGTWVEERQLFDRWFGVVCRPLPYEKKLPPVNPFRVSLVFLLKYFNLSFSFSLLLLFIRLLQQALKSNCPFPFVKIYIFLQPAMLSGVAIVPFIIKPSETVLWSHEGEFQIHGAK